MKTLWKFFLLLYRITLAGVLLVPFFVMDVFRGIKSGISLGRVDFENDLSAQKEAVQRELFRLSSYPNISPEEVLKNGHRG